MWVAAIFLLGMIGIVVAISLSIVYYKRRRAKIREEIGMRSPSRLTAFRISDRIKEGIKYCKHCGKPNPEIAQYCIDCGKPI